MSKNGGGEGERAWQERNSLGKGPAVESRRRLEEVRGVRPAGEGLTPHAPGTTVRNINFIPKAMGTL